MEGHWSNLLKADILRIFSLKRYWKLICGFLEKVSLINEKREAYQIENSEKFLNSLAKIIVTMRENGCPEEEIQKIVMRQHALIQANLEAMIIARQFNINTQSKK